MSLAVIFALAIALGIDAFSIALAIGLSGLSMTMVLRLSLLVAVFHVFMPLTGMILGQTMGAFLGQFAELLGAIVLFWLGGRMFYGVLRPEIKHYPLSQARKLLDRNKVPASVNIHGTGALFLAASVSLDALSVGFSLGTVKSQIGLTIIIMGIVAGLMMGSGLLLGRYVGTKVGERASLFGGLILVIIGIRLIL